jgi:hypothetical protein
MKLETSLIKLIYHILHEDIEARDNWMLTIQKVYDSQMLYNSIKKEDFYNSFFKENSPLTNCQTIVRLWRKVQEDYPLLRGDMWEQRQKKGGQFNANDFISNQTSLFSKEEMKDIAKLKTEVSKSNSLDIGNVYLYNETKNLVIINIEKNDGVDILMVRICDITEENICITEPLVPMNLDYFKYQIDIGNYTFIKRILI